MLLRCSHERSSDVYYVCAWPSELEDASTLCSGTTSGLLYCGGNSFHPVLWWVYKHIQLLNFEDDKLLKHFNLIVYRRHIPLLRRKPDSVWAQSNSRDLCYLSSSLSLNTKWIFGPGKTFCKNWLHLVMKWKQMLQCKREKVLNGSRPHSDIEGYFDNIYFSFIIWYFSIFPSAWLQVLGTAMLLLCLMALADKRNQPAQTGAEPVATGALVLLIGVSMGSNSGYAINPTRDLAPRVFTAIAGWGLEVFR